jgi:hypothetical protein
MFGLTFDKRFAAWSLEGYETFPIPPLLAEIRKERDFVTCGSPYNEALARMAINEILVTCIAEEKRRILGGGGNVPGPSHPSDLTSTSGRPTTPTSLDPAPLILQLEPRLSYVVEYQNEKRLLQGNADYSLWHDGNGAMGTNLVLVEAKRRGLLSAADGQLIAYMGIVHRTRESSKKQNMVVYGISTDGNEFKFWRLDNSGQLTRSRIYDWDGGDGTTIISYMRLIVRAAIHSSPSTSPVKDAKERGVSLSIYHDTGRAASFDYGIGRLAIWDEDNDEDDDLEILA